MTTQEYYQKHKEDVARYNDEWRRKHPENVKAWGHTRYSRHKDKMLAKSKQYYLQHREEILERAKTYRAGWTPEQIMRDKEKKYRWGQSKRKKVWDQLFQIYGNKCACCGESNRQFLTLDHINGNGTVERRQKRKEKGRSSAHGLLDEAVAHPDKSKYQILCYNCNCGRWRNKGVCPHHDKAQ